MQSGSDAKSVEEPWFTLSKNKYQSILDQALSEMDEDHEPEEVGTDQLELTNCTELIKLLNQDDGLDKIDSCSGVGVRTLHADGAARIGASEGHSVRNGSWKKKAETSLDRSFQERKTTWKNVCGTKRVRGANKGSSLPCKSSRIQSRCSNGLVPETSGREFSAVSTQGRMKVIGGVDYSVQALRQNSEHRNSAILTEPPTNTDCSHRLQTLSALNFHDIGRRPSSAADKGQLKVRSSLKDESIIPDLDLSHSQVFSGIKVELDCWPSSNTFPRTFQATVRNVKVKLEDTTSEDTFEKTDRQRDSESDVGRVPSQSDWRSSYSEMTSLPPNFRVRTQVPVVEKTSFPKSLNSASSCPNMVDYIGFSRRKVDLNSMREFPHQPNTANRTSPYSLKYERKYARRPDCTGRQSSSLREESQWTPGSDSESIRGGGEDQSRKVEPSRNEFVRFGVSPGLEQHGGVTQGWRIFPDPWDRELWAAVDKSVVNLMMQQILDEESLKIQEQDTPTDGNIDQNIPHETVLPPDPTTFPVEAIPVEDVSFSGDLDVLAQGQDELSSQHEISDFLCRADTSQDCVYDLRIKHDASDSFYSARDSFRVDSNRPLVEQVSTRHRRLSLIEEPPVMDQFQSEADDVGLISAQEIGMSVMSIKWKSNILHRLQKDQISASKWHLSETLSV